MYLMRFIERLVSIVHDVDFRKVQTWIVNTVQFPVGAP